MSNRLETFTSELQEGSVTSGNHRWEYDNVQLPIELIEWFISSGKCFERHTSEKSIIDKIKISNTTNNQCFQNTQLISLKNDGINYYEGLVYGTEYKMTFHHGFNVIDEKAFDVTDFYNNTFKSDKSSNWYKEKEILYYGIHIPNEFLTNYIEKLNVPKVHNPLIFEYYNFLNK